MKWTIKAKMLANFSVLIVLTLIIGLWNIIEINKNEKLASVNMVSAMDAADGAMESRINYLHSVWGTMEAVYNFDETSQNEGLSRIKAGEKGFSETIALLESSGLLSKVDIEKMIDTFDGLKSNSTKLRNLSIEKNKQMEKLDNQGSTLIEENLDNFGSLETNHLWTLIMAANDYSSSKDVKFKTEFDNIYRESKQEFSSNTAFINVLEQLHDSGYQLFELVKEYEISLEAFDEYAEILDEAMEAVEEGSNGVEGSDEYMNRILAELIHNSKEARMVSIIILLISIVVSVIIALTLAEKMSRPIRKFTEVAQKLSEGDLNVDTSTNQNDEIGDLAKALQRMIEKLSMIVTEIRSAADNVNAGSQELSSSSQQMSEGTTEQAASAEEASSSMEEMTSNIQQNSENAHETEKVSTNVAERASESGRAVAETAQAMNEIAEKISIIEEIARQTNMLALNAAIEAARAGEHGKGFAVVADAVRKLAERSQESAAEINDLASSSVKVAEKAGVLLDELLPDIQKTSDLVQEINAASMEQSTGADQINTSIQQLDQIIQQNASMAEELSSTAEELSSQAEQMVETISFFRLNDNNRKSSLATSRVKKSTSVSNNPPNGKNNNSLNQGVHFVLDDNGSPGDELDKSFKSF